MSAMARQVGLKLKRKLMDLYGFEMTDDEADEMGLTAIEALREPTDEMVDAPGRLLIAREHEARETWKAMISAALGEDEVTG